MRSATLTLDPLATHQEIRRLRGRRTRLGFNGIPPHANRAIPSRIRIRDETNAWRRGAGKGHSIAGASVFAAELDRGLSASASTRASTAVRGTTGE
jgi:hypothetical protein